MAALERRIGRQPSTSVQFPPEQKARLLEIAQTRQLSFADVVREAVRGYLAAQDRAREMADLEAAA